MTEEKYIAWIPCISGRLLFRHFSCGHPRTLSSTNVVYPPADLVAHDDTRQVVLLSTLNLKDQGSETIDGKFTFLLIGEKKPKPSQFTGTIIVIPAKVAEKNQDWQPIRESIDEALRSALQLNPIGSSIARLREHLDIFSHPELNRVTFNVDEMGFTTLQFISRAQPDHANHIHAITKQCFYFLKYSLHRHQHHDPGNDGITKIHKMPDDAKDVGSLLINDLRVTLIELKRNSVDFQGDVIEQARGIVEYTKSLIESCKRIGFLENREYSHQRAYFDNLSGSLKITSQQRYNRILRSVTTRSNARSLILFFVSIFAPIIFLFKSPISKKITEAGGPPDGLIDFFASIFASGWKLGALITVIVFAFILYSIVYTRYPEPLVLLHRYEKFIQEIVFDETKARIIKYTTLLIGFLIVLFSGLSFFSVG